jgi:hypothetical protein
MRKKTKALSGASQDAYFRRVLKAHPALSAEERDKLVGRLRAEIAQLRVRVAPYGEGNIAPRPAQEAKGAMVLAASNLGSTTPVAQVLATRAPAASPPAEPPPATTVPPASPVAAFDPFTPNVIVVVRKSGRAAALAALNAIASLDDLRLLAREQRLSIASGLQEPTEVRAAIVAAAERRIANRMAAAS